MKKFKVKFEEKQKTGLVVEREIEVEASCVEKVRSQVKENYNIEALTPIVVEYINPRSKEPKETKQPKQKPVKKKIKKENIIDKDSKQYKKYLKRISK